MSVAPVETDTIDVADLARSVRRGWRYVVGAVVLGALAAFAVLEFVPARFSADSSIIVHAPERGLGAATSALGGGTLQDAASSLLPGALTGSSIETDVQVLASRALASEAVDSLELQLRVRSRERLAPWQIAHSASFPGSFKRARLHFAHAPSGAGYQITGWGAPVNALPGVPAHVGPGTLTLANDTLPQAFDVDVYDREDAITRFQKRLGVSKPGGEVVAISYQGDDSLTAAAVPNLLVRRYLDRRHTTDRGINERRVEFLTRQVDSVERELNDAQRALRREQEASGVIDPTVVGKLELEQASELRGKAGDLDVERGALDHLLAQLSAGEISSRQLAAYPTFLKSPAVNDLLSQLSTLETKRLQLLATYTPQDPSVVAATEGIKNIENQLVPLARAYRSSVDRQRADLGKQLDTLQGSIAKLPAETEMSSERQRDVLRLGQTDVALRAQLVAARLAAIGEGGDVRLLDVAMPPRKVSFPTTPLTMGLGLGGGLVLGLIAAVLAGFFGRYAPDARAVERQVGVPALALDAETPLAFAAMRDVRTLLLVPLDADADTAGVAERIMRTAAGRGIRGTVLDLTTGGSAATNGESLERLAAEFSLVAVRTPKLSSDATLALLDPERPVVFVASAGRVDRRALSAGVEAVRRFGAPCAGVVLSRRTAPVLARG